MRLLAITKSMRTERITLKTLANFSIKREIAVETRRSEQLEKNQRSVVY